MSSSSSNDIVRRRRSQRATKYILEIENMPIYAIRWLFEGKKTSHSKQNQLEVQFLTISSYLVQNIDKEDVGPPLEHGLRDGLADAAGPTSHDAVLPGEEIRHLIDISIETQGCMNARIVLKRMRIDTTIYRGVRDVWEPK